MKKLLPSLIIVSLVLSSPGIGVADVIKSLRDKPLEGTRGFDVEARIRNDRPAFPVRVSVDREDRTYEKGELMTVTVQSGRDGYLYLLYKQADGKSKCLFPNVYESDNRIRGGAKITIPTPKQGFQLRCNDPLGDELLVAVVAKRPMKVEALGVRSVTEKVVTDIDLDSFATAVARGMDPEGTAPIGQPHEWAEHAVQIKTVPAGTRNVAPRGPQRLGLFIGISTYKDHPRIRNLSICHLDAEVMAKVMEDHCRLDAVGVLINEQATRKSIEKAFNELKLNSRPGDEIFIYWSGHGASCADTDGEEEDGLDGVLIPYDGKADDAAGTMILDDTLGRWVQALDGRKVTVIIDACHSAEQAAGRGIKGADAQAGPIIRRVNDAAPAGADSVDALLKSFTAPDKVAVQWGPVSADFLGVELRGIKDIGQDDAVMLFSSAPDEISAERRDGKLSVMTYFLVEQLLTKESLTLQQAYDYVKVEVPKYMRRHFPGRTQTPQLLPEESAPAVRLR